jgi:hypothetical protein
MVSLDVRFAFVSLDGAPRRWRFPRRGALNELAGV